MFNSTDGQIFDFLSRAVPTASAILRGSENYPNLIGSIKFYQTNIGVFVVISVSGLPVSSEKCANRFFAIHIHNGAGCIGSTAEPFKDSGEHLNSENCPHPSHTGDMPPLLADDEGGAWSAFFINRYRVDNIVGMPVIIHSGADDFTTQPSGNSGSKIACGIIKF